MTSLQWEEIAPKKISASHVSKQKIDPWFGVSMIFIGIILGFIMGNLLNGKL